VVLLLEPLRGRLDNFTPVNLTVVLQRQLYCRLKASPHGVVPVIWHVARHAAESYCRNELEFVEIAYFAHGTE
jgi:hypothetical protein